MSTLMQVVLFASAIGCVHDAAYGAVQSQDSKTVRISRDDPAAKSLGEPAAKSQEALDRLGPLDWTKTSGKPRQVEPTAAELKALAEAKPQMVEGGPPDREVEEEALRAQPAQEQQQPERK